MDTPPVPKPRTTLGLPNDTSKQPIPLPRTKLTSNNERASTASDIFRSISSVSKQFTEDVAFKVRNTAKSANGKLERKILDGSKFAKDTIDKTLTTSRAVRDSVTRSVIDSTKTSLRLRKLKKADNVDDESAQRCVSMPAVDVSFFENIQFHSPMLEQKVFSKIERDQNSGFSNDLPFLNLNSNQFDDLSLYSSNFDSNTDTVSNFSNDSKECDQLTYDTPKASRANSVVSNMSAPEVPERRKKRESLDVVRQNSLYENWNLPQCNISSSYISRPSRSTIFEFDPLNTTPVTNKYQGVSNELLLLESFLIGDTYGTIISTENNQDDNFDEFTESEYFNPPTPPERSDSLFSIENTVKSETVASIKNSNSNWFLDNEDDNQSTSSEIKHPTSVMQKFSNMLKFDSVRQKTTKNNNMNVVQTVERPPVNHSALPYFSGTLTRIVSGVEDLFKKSEVRYCVIADQVMKCYADTSNTILKEAYPLENIYSLQIVLPLSSSTSNHSYCIEISVATTGLRQSARKLLFSCTSAPERRNWAQKIAENLTGGFSTKFTSEFTRMGWCYLKEGVSGTWNGAWAMLIRRVLVYYTTQDPAVRTVDLRKTRCVVTQVADEETKKICPVDSEHNLVLDCPQVTIYLRFPTERELKGWRFMVKMAAHNNGTYLHHQQLTKDDVPTIVDKCISFLYAHGSLSEGIYRRAGGNQVLAELLASFRKDAWSVQIIPGKHSEHDVAGVLKRFFRDLPEPLIPQEKQQALVAALRLEDETQRHAEYRAVMSSLPLVSKNTARKLFAHLHFLHTLSETNKMNAENLAAIWGPNIMPGVLTTSPLETAWSSKDMFVVRDMILHYESIWEPTETENLREKAVRRVLMRVLSSSAPAPPKAAGDLKAWVYIIDRSTCHQITLTPNKTCADVCIELCDKANQDSHLLTLEEVICNDSMRRIVHIDEVVLDVVLRWSYWDEEDRKDNYLLLKDNKVLHEIDGLRHSTSLVCGELKFASETSKSFKLHMFECKNSKLSYFKDKQGSHKVEEWNIKDIVWYVGHEPKRNPQTRWAITFIVKKDKCKRSKLRPWFGCTIAGAITEDQLKWMTAMMFAEHNNILPTPRLIIT